MMKYKPYFSIMLFGTSCAYLHTHKFYWELRSQVRFRYFFYLRGFLCDNFCYFLAEEAHNFNKYSYDRVVTEKDVPYNFAVSFFFVKFYNSLK